MSWPARERLLKTLALDDIGARAAIIVLAEGADDETIEAARIAARAAREAEAPRAPVPPVTLHLETEPGPAPAVDAGAPPAIESTNIETTGAERPPAVDAGPTGQTKPSSRPMVGNACSARAGDLTRHDPGAKEGKAGTTISWSAADETALRKLRPVLDAGLTRAEQAARVGLPIPSFYNFISRARRLGKLPAPTTVPDNTPHRVDDLRGVGDARDRVADFEKPPRY